MKVPSLQVAGKGDPLVKTLLGDAGLNKESSRTWLRLLGLDLSKR